MSEDSGNDAPATPVSSAPKMVPARDASGSVIKDARGNIVMISLDSADAGVVKEEKPKVPEGTGLCGFSEEFVEFTKYIAFLALFCVVVFGPRNAEPYYMVKAMDDFFISNEFDYGVSFGTLSSLGQFWTFLNATLMPNVFPMYGLNGELISRPAQRFLSDGANYRVGAVRFRTIRVNEDICKVPKSLSQGCDLFGDDDCDDDDGVPPIDACFPSYNIVEMDKLEPKEGDKFRPMAKFNNESNLCFKYNRTTGQPNYYSIVTGITYSGNGYVIDLGVEQDPNDKGRCSLDELYDDDGSIAPSPKPTVARPTPDPSYPTPYPTMKPTGYKTDMESRAQEQLNMLKAAEFIDRATRAVFVEFTVYNANSDMFVVVRLCVETTSSGTVIPTATVKPANLLTPYRVLTGDGLQKRKETVFLWCELALYFLALCYLFGELREWYTLRKLYLKGEHPHGYFYGWNIVDLINLALFAAVAVQRVFMIYQVSDMVKNGSFTNPEFNVDVQNAVEFVNSVDTMNSINAVICFIKLFKYLDSHPSLGQFTRTISQAQSDLGSFLLVIIIVLTGFGIAFMLAFGHDEEGYSTLRMSFLALFEGMLGNLDTSVLHSPSFLGPLLFMAYVVVMIFVVLSMFLSIVDNAYSIVQEEMAEKSQELDPLSRDVLWCLGAPERLFSGFLSLFFSLANKIDRIVPVNDDDGGASALEGEESKEGEAKEEVPIEPEVDVDQAMESDEKFVAYTATYKKTIDSLSELKESQRQLNDMLTVINKHLEKVDHPGHS